jgi:predicted DNA-binding WGR domain protein
MGKIHKPLRMSSTRRRSPRLTAAASKARAVGSKSGFQSPVKKKAAAAKKPRRSPVKAATTTTPHATARFVGVVDPEFQQGPSQQAGVAEDENGFPYDVFLVLIEPAINSDKFYVLQLVYDDGAFTTFSRWGRTGLKGQTQSFGPFTKLEDAVVGFEKKFKEKTGNTWDDYRNGMFVSKPSKYEALSSPLAATVRLARQAGVTWEYEVTDMVAGKANGWYPYDEANADEVETVYQAFVGNPQAVNLHKRQISSESSGFDYVVDLVNFVQRNTQTGKMRNVHRVNPNNHALTAVPVG